MPSVAARRCARAALPWALLCALLCAAAAAPRAAAAAMHGSSHRTRVPLQQVQDDAAAQAPAGAPAAVEAAGASLGGYFINTSPSPSGALPNVTSWLDPAGAHDGSAGGALRVRIDALPADAAPWNVELLSPTTTLDAGSAYRWTFWARASAPVTLSAFLLQLPSYAPLASAALQLTPAWARYAVAWTRPPPPSAQCYYQVQLGGAALVGVTVDFDSFQVVSTPLDTAWGDAAPTAARITASRQARLSLKFVDAGGAPLSGTISNLQLQLVQHAFPFGTAFAPEYHRDGVDPYAAWYRSTAAAMFPGGITPEVAFKWPTYEPARDQVDASAALIDTEYTAFARAKGMLMQRGHTLSWGTDAQQCQAALASGAADAGASCFWALQGPPLLDCATYEAALMRRIDRDVARHRGAFTHYDVWNEPLHNPGMLSVCGGLWSGPGGGPHPWLVAAFKRAAAADPAARLCLGDYGLIEGDATEDFVALVKALLAAGAPVHCISAQAHLQSGRLDPAMFNLKLNLLSATGLPVHISEYSLFSSATWGLGSVGGVNNMTEDEQAAQMTQHVTWMFSHPAVQSITFWGFWDSQHFIQNGGIYAADTRPKKAAPALQRLWRESWNTSYSAKSVQASKGVSFQGFPGKYAYSFKYGNKNRVYSGWVQLPGGTSTSVIGAAADAGGGAAAAGRARDCTAQAAPGEDGGAVLCVRLGGRRQRGNLLGL